MVFPLKLGEQKINDPSRRYILISPCRDEAAYIQTTIDSIVSQSILPAKWIVVDDGSTDDTPKLLAEASRQYPFIEVIRYDAREKRNVGPGVIEAFYVAFQTINLNDYDYLCKFDMDLEIPPNYFESLIKRMESNPRIGTCSGKPYFRNQQGRLVSEKCGDEMSVGMTKFYRVTCFEQIGGFVREVMWDGIDCHRCRMLGWIACSWDDPEIRFIHLRPMGSSQKGVLAGRMRHGFGQYFMGTGLLYMAISALYRMTRPPFVIGGLTMLVGYLKSWLAGECRYEDPQFRKFLRRYQWNCLMRGKTQATQQLNEYQVRQWNPPKSEG
jgi:glycosyltransferase involved in cell wall biosynthesis